MKLSVSLRGDAPVFVGIAPAADVANYLAGIQHSVLLDLPTGDGRSDPVYRQEAGGAPTLAPEDVNIWAAQASGTGRQSLIWPVEAGDWSVVVMNADASSPVSAAVAVGATFPGLDWVEWTLVGVALLLLVVGIVLMILALATGSRPSPGPGAPVRQTATP